jgi:CheY-like chemotaxis protein
MSGTSASQESSETSELEIKSILLLDDDSDLADTLKLLLESRNFVVTTVANGVDGLREIMSLDFDVIICDMMMPRCREICFTSRCSGPSRTSAHAFFSSRATATIQSKLILEEGEWAGAFQAGAH